MKRAWVGLGLVILPSLAMSAPKPASATTVYRPIPVHGTPLGNFVCSILLQKYGTEAEHRGLLLPDGLPVYALAETYAHPVSGLLSDAKATADDGTLAEVAATMHQARNAAGDGTPPFFGGTPNATSPYFALERMILGVRVGDTEYRVLLAPRDDNGSVAALADGLFIRKPAQRVWVWMADGFFSVDRQLLATDEASDHAAMLPNDETVKRVVPAAVLDAMTKANLPAEMAGFPSEGPEDPEAETWFPDPAYFVVRDPASHERIGYLLVQDQIIESDFDDASGLYRAHFARGATRTQTHSRHVIRHVARFDLAGNRVEVWRADESFRARFRLVERTVKEQAFVVLHPGFEPKGPARVDAAVFPAPLRTSLPQDDGPRRNAPRTTLDLEVPAALAPRLAAQFWKQGPRVTSPFSPRIPEFPTSTAMAFAPNGRYLAIADGGTVRLQATATGSEVAHYRWQEQPFTTLTFAQDGRSIFIGYSSGRVRVVDLQTGADLWFGQVITDRYLAPAAVEHIAELPGRRLLISHAGTSSRDSVAILLDWSTGERTVVLENAGAVRALANGAAYASHWHAGLTVVATAWKQDRLSFGPPSKATTQRDSNGRTVYFTARQNHQFWSPSGDHFQSVHYSDGTEHHRLFPDGYLQRIRGLPELAGSAVRATDLGPDGTSYVGDLRHGVLDLWHVDAEGTATAVPAHAVGTVRATAFAPQGALLAVAGEHAISVFQLNGHEAPTRLTQFQTDAAVDELRFTANHAAIYYRQTDGKIAAAAIHD